MTILCIGDSHVRRFHTFVGHGRASSEIFNIANLPQVNFLGISGGAVNNSRHRETILAAVQHHRPTCLIVHIGGNDLDRREDSVDATIYGLVAFLTQLRRQFAIDKIMVMRLLPRERTRYIDPGAYNSRVVRANALLKNQCREVGLLYWRMKGFTQSRDHILSDGVHLNPLGLRKYYRHVRGILLSIR
jgi:lysophospholipase L1-like esterase